MATYQFPVSLGRYVRVEIPGDSMSAEEWTRMLAILALFRSGLVVEDDPEVVTLAGQRLTTGTDPQLTRRTWSQTPPYEEVE